VESARKVPESLADVVAMPPALAAGN